MSAKRKGATRANPDKLKNEGEKKFSALRADSSALRASLPSPVHIATAQKWIHTVLRTMCPLPSTFLDPPLRTAETGRAITTILVVCLTLFFLFFSITSLCQGWQRVQKLASKANNEMHPYYKERVSKVLNTETEHAVVILLGREFQSEVEWGIKEYK